MAYPTGGTINRADIRTALEQGLDALEFTIAEKVAPIYNGDAKAGQYLRRTLEQRRAMKIENNRRAPGTSYPEVTNSWETATYQTEDYGYQSKVDDSLKAYANRYLDLEVSTSRILDTKNMLAYEKRVAGLFYGTTATASLFPSTAATVNYQQANLATVDFVNDVQQACERQRALGTVANTVILSFPLWNFVRRCSLFQNYVRGNFPTVLPTQLTPEQAAGAFFDQGIKKFQIAGAYEDIGDEGQVYLGAPIWGNNVFWVGKVGGGDFMAGGAARTITWDEDGGFKAVESFRDELVRSDVLRVRQSVVEKIIDERAGQLVTTTANF